MARMGERHDECVAKFEPSVAFDPESEHLAAQHQVGSHGCAWDVLKHPGLAGRDEPVACAAEHPASAMLADEGGQRRVILAWRRCGVGVETIERKGHRVGLDELE